MPADTLTPTGSVVTLAAPGPDEKGHPSSYLSYVAIPGHDEIIVMAASASASDGNTIYKITATAYASSGAVISQMIVSDANGSTDVENSPAMILLANGNVAFGYNVVTASGDAHNNYAVAQPNGDFTRGGALGSTAGPQFAITGPADLYATATGFSMDWRAQTRPADGPQTYAEQVQSFDATGAQGPGSSEPQPGPGPVPHQPHAIAAGASGTLQITDNAVQFVAGTSFHPAVIVPREPAHAITDEAAAMLGGGQAAVAWVDSGTDYVALFNPQTNSFGPVIGLDWGGAADVHVVGLLDGGFAVSWTNGGVYKGEVFTADGTGGGIIGLAGDVAGIDSHGDLFTVALDANGAYEVQTYAVGGAPAGGVAYTAAASYTAPFNVTEIHLTGSNQTVHANDRGDVIWSDNTRNFLFGGGGDDVIHLGRGGDVATGGGGNDTFAFDEIPWAYDGVRDFQPGDTIDLTGLMATTADKGTDGFADGYLRLIDDGANSEIEARYATLGDNSQWWVVATITGMPASHLQTSGDLITASGGQVIYTASPSYTTGPNVSEIHLLGSNQTVNASSDQQGVTIYSDNTINQLTGTAFDDTFYLGRGGDKATGGSGADTFVFNETPWRIGAIDDFNAAEGDSIDVHALIATTGYTGSDPVADGYLRFVDEPNNSSLIQASYNQPGNDGWWDVALVLGVPAGSLHYAGGLIT